MFGDIDEINVQLNAFLEQNRNKFWGKIKTNCYHYTEWHDMGATIPCCSLQDFPGCIPCENCHDYISNSEVSNMVREMKKRKEEGSNGC